MFMSTDQDGNHMCVSPDQNGSLCDGQMIMSHKSSAAVTLPNLGSFAPHPTDDCDPAADASCHMQLVLLSVVVANAKYETMWDSDHTINCWHPHSWLKQQPVPDAGIVAHQMIASQTSGSVWQTPEHPKTAAGKSFGCLKAQIHQ